MDINNNSNLDSMHLVSKFGILKERLSAILTDAIRANILQYYGYKTQLLEFIDFEATPKNILIRATLTNNKNEKAKEEALKKYEAEELAKLKKKQEREEKAKQKAIEKEKKKYEESGQMQLFDW